MPINGRQLALRELSSLRRIGDAELSSCINRLRSEQEIDYRDRSLAERILIGTFQNREYLDYCLCRICGSKFKNIHPLLKDILRIGAYQIIFLDRVPAHAAVSESVNLARKKLNPGAASMANAVLRRLSSMSPYFFDLSEMQLNSRLSVRYSHPLWLTDRLISRVGAENTERFFALDNEPAAIWLQVNSLRENTGEAFSFLGDGIGAETVAGVPGFIKLKQLSDKAEKLLADGLAYVQDLSARMTVIAADPKPGDVVLDTCAAPGGKSFSAAIAMQGQGRIIASDISENRLNVLKENADRLKMDIIETRCRDAAESSAFSDISADVVFVDVPCSGFGTIRKKPEIRSKAPHDLERLHELQYDILSNAAQSVKHGGTLIYSTCTVFYEENEAVVQKFISEHSDFLLCDFLLPEPFGSSENGMYTIWPWIADSDGFYIAKLRRT